jgi:hypothetical protein
LLNKYNDYFKDDNDVISLHFRVGDYKNLPDYHPLLPLNYYINSLRKMVHLSGKDVYKVIYFYENGDKEYVDKMVGELKKEFPKMSFFSVDHSIPDWHQLLIMSLCNHNIIANSSFSWWGAYFNTQTDKIVCYPSVWFGEIANNNTKDLCPTDWNKINV